MDVQPHASTQPMPSHFDTSQVSSPFCRSNAFCSVKPVVVYGLSITATGPCAITLVVVPISAFRWSINVLVHSWRVAAKDATHSCLAQGTAFVDGSVLGFLLAAAVVVVLVNLVLRSRESCLPRLKNRGPDPFDEDGVRTLTCGAMSRRCSGVAR
eukprot:scaffold1085_cov407-Prasinococcus_capsulatus_cf.AAC.50